MKIRNAAFVVLFCALPNVCSALAPTASSGQLIITEVMYDPSGTDYGHEWIEVYNAGTSGVTLSKYKIVEGSAKHNIVAVPPTGGSLTSGTFAVIAENAADFQSDYPGFAGELFHSALSLDNAGATIEIVDASSTVAASATYDSGQGALGDGNSLQRSAENDAFAAREPSPGASISSSVIPAKTKAIAAKKSSTRSSSAKPDQESTASSYAPEASARGEQVAATDTQTAAAGSSSTNGDLIWWGAAAALALASAAAMYIARRYKAHEWDIVEES